LYQVGTSPYLQITSSRTRTYYKPPEVLLSHNFIVRASNKLESCGTTTR